MKTILGLFKIEALEEDELEIASDAIKPDKTDYRTCVLKLAAFFSPPSSLPSAG